MDERRDKLEEWRHRSLITIDQEEAIEAAEGIFEVGRAERRIPEALAYLGGLLFLIGGLILAFDSVEVDALREPSSTRAFTIALLVSIALGAAAWYLRGRDDQPVALRATAVVAGLAVVAFAVAAAIFFFDLFDFGDSSLLIMGLALTAVSFPAWRWRPAAPTQIVLALSLGLVVVGILAIIVDDLFFFGPDEGDLTVGGLLFAGLGLAWLVLTYRGTFRPTNTGYVLGTVLAYVGFELLAAIADGWIILQIAFGISLVLAGVWMARTLMIALGMWGAVVGLARLLGILFDTAVPTGTVSIVLGAAALGGAIAFRRRPRPLGPRPGYPEEVPSPAEAEAPEPPRPEPAERLPEAPEEATDEGSVEGEALPPEPGDPD